MTFWGGGGRRAGLWDLRSKLFYFDTIYAHARESILSAYLTRSLSRNHETIILQKQYPYNSELI